MKKRNLILVTCAILVLTFILILVKDNDKTLKQDGIIYALSVDGKKTNKFPDKGMYQVDVDCENADGKWDYENWKLDISDMNGNVSCGLEFKTIEKTYFNNYIMDMDGSNTGDGILINEQAEAPNYEKAVKLAKGEYVSASQYSSTSSSATSGTEVQNVFTFNSDNEWEMNTANVTSGTYYNLAFKVPSDSYYQICFDIEAGNVNNYFALFSNSNNIFDRFALKDGEKKGCYDLGLISSSDNLIIKYRPYSDTNNGIAKAKISIQKVGLTKVDNYRYEGKNPSNYVLFNNELWRIIGVFDENTHGQKGLNLVKIIRNSPISTLIWNNDEAGYSYGANWDRSTVKEVLNDTYYNRKSTMDSDRCYVSQYDKGICDYTATGLKESYKDWIKEAKWYLGIKDIYSSQQPASYYYQERSNRLYEGENHATGYIGLIYPSDYCYSVLESSCPRTTNLTSYNTAKCAGQNWLYMSSEEYTLTREEMWNNMYYPIYIANSGSINYSNESKAIRPTLYLNENVFVYDGDGSLLDPYIIGM